VDENTKRKHDALVDEHKTAWDSLLRRTGTEWKVSFAFWTALASFSAILIKDGAHKASIGLPLWLTIIAGVFVLAAHLWFVCGVARGNGIDHRKLGTYEAAMMLLTGIEWDPELEARIRGAADHKGPLGYWAQISQILVTVTLVIVACTLVWWVGSLAGHTAK
jgi:hypothetical protein